MSHNLKINIAAWFIFLTLLLIGIYDVVAGCYLLVSPTPWLVNGSDTVWTSVEYPDDTMISIFHRLGVYSLHTGILTIVLACYARTRTMLRTVVLITYLVTGIAFGIYDGYWFSGTIYWQIKTGIGVVFTCALIVQLIGVWNNWWHKQNHD